MRTVGLVNTILFISTRRLLPDMTSLPRFTTQRNGTMSTSEHKYGVTPFSLGDAVVCTSPTSMSSVTGGRENVVDEHRQASMDEDALSVDSLNLHPPPVVTEDSLRYGVPSGMAVSADR